MKNINKIDGETMVINTKEINKKLKNPSEFLTFSENRILNQIDDCAAQILPLANTKPIILISGPSGSSKTTTAIKLAKALRKNGADVCYISMDKYFKNFTDEEKALKRQNKLDLESPERVDAKCLNKDIDVLLNGGEIYLPSYDFLTNTRTLSQTRLCRNGGFVIIEGIHALNPTLLGENDDVSSRFYVSVRTRVVDSNGDKLHPCKIRLCRRMIRDKLYRGRNFDETIRLFSKVQRGENQFIIPNKSRANFNIDTFIEYEPCIYRNYLFDDLKELSEKFSDIKDIFNALDEIEPLDDSLVASDAFIREFIGNSSLSY